MKKSQLLAAAIQNCQYNSFEYYLEGRLRQSSDDVRRILFSFQSGRGHYLLKNAALVDDHSYAVYTNGDGKAKMEAQQAFRDTSQTRFTS
jgi:hypothetical protein